MSANPYIAAYIKELDRLYLTGLTIEHSFRPALQKLLENLCLCTVVNEQSHIDCGAPDLTLLGYMQSFQDVLLRDIIPKTTPFLHIS